MSFGQGHVGAILTVENMRKAVAIPDGEKHQRGKASWVCGDVINVDAFAFQLCAHEATHLFIADPREHGGLKPKSRYADGRVGRRSTQIFGKSGNIFQRTTDLLAIKIDCGTAHADEVVWAIHDRRLFGARVAVVLVDATRRFFADFSARW